MNGPGDEATKDEEELILVLVMLLVVKFYTWCNFSLAVVLARV